MSFEPPFLLARFGPAQLEPPSPLPGRTSLSVPMEAFTAHFLYAGVSTARATTADGDVALLLVGEVYGTASAVPARSLLEAFLDKGPLLVRGLHGSFAIVVADARSNQVYVVTDPVNSRQIFLTEGGDTNWIATSPAFHLLPDNGVDELGVAQFMINGIPLNNRTLFSGTRVMPQAAIHRFSGSGWQSTPYWRYEFRDANLDRSRLRTELPDLLTAAVQRSVTENDRAFVSLSGGYDSTAILCILRRLGMRDVQCFSYADPDEGDSGDAGVARRLCHSLGYDHSIISTYRAPLLDVLRTNIAYGHGLTRLVIEADAWREIGESVVNTDDAVVLAGDQCLGRRDRDLRTDSDVLAELGISGWRALGWFGRILPPDTRRRWGQAVDAELAEIIELAPTRGNRYDLRDTLYLEQRLPRILAWRENFAGRFARVRLPLLDQEILDFMRGVPIDLRLDKRLFRKALEEMFPRELGLPRAVVRSSMVQKWAARAVREDAGLVRALILEQDSPLDDYIPQEALLRLLKRCSRPVWSTRLGARSLRKGRRVIRQLRRTRTDRPDLLPESENLILVRALLLRELLSNRRTRPELTTQHSTNTAAI